MSDLDTKDREKLDKDQFAYVDKEGGEHLPIHDESHVPNAMARWNQTDFESDRKKEEARKEDPGRRETSRDRGRLRRQDREGPGLMWPVLRKNCCLVLSCRQLLEAVLMVEPAEDRSRPKLVMQGKQAM